MYAISDIKSVHLEVTSNCQASCPMCARNLQGGVINPFITETELTLTKFKNWFPPEFLLQLDRLYMCGNLGDPIIAKDTLEIFEYIRTISTTINLSMNTNGSARTVDWWSKLAKLNVQVRVGIDGLADTHALYRIGTNFNKIIENLTAFINAGGYAIWDMLVFQHNVHQIDECKQLSTMLGFSEFHTKNTSRFVNNKLHVLDSTGKTIHVLYPTEKSKQITSSVIDTNTYITCKVQKEKSLYISATGNVSPCCWLDSEWKPLIDLKRIDYMDKIGTYYNLHNLLLEEIFESNIFNKIQSLWNSDPLIECSKQCGKLDRFNEQFK